MTSVAEHMVKMKAVRGTEGVRGVLIYLNGLTVHRFTALYRFDADILKNLVFFDREHPEIASCPEIPVMASYCVFVRNSRQQFAMADSLVDPRALDHPKRLEIRSYCGVPLVDEHGRMFGTVCHFDTRPLQISDENVELMELVARML